MTLQALIDKQDNFEIVRGQLATILAAETAAQQALATTAARDPREWAFRVFIERSDPWSEFQDGDDDALDVTPIVNVVYDSTRFDKSQGNVVQRQRGEMQFHIDCYAYGVAADDGDDGHVAGDHAAALALGRTVRLVRNILMASEYIALGLPAVIGRRWINTVQVFQPPSGQEALQKVLGARITLEVLANEFSPQYEGVPLELVAATVRRDTGEVLLTAHIDTTADS
jgi:hypothetical protein